MFACPYMYYFANWMLSFDLLIQICHSFLLQMLLILLSILSKEGKVDEKDFAKRLQDWMIKGFPELGDQGKYVP